MLIELLSKTGEATEALTGRLARLMTLLDTPLKLKRVLVSDPTVPTPALRAMGETHTIRHDIGDEELLELLDELVGNQ